MGRSNWRQAFAAYASAIAQNGAATLAGISVKETMLPFPPDF